MVLYLITLAQACLPSACTYQPRKQEREQPPRQGCTHPQAASKHHHRLARGWDCEARVVWAFNLRLDEDQ